MHILTGNGDAPQWKWGCASPIMHIFTENAHPHRECASPGMGMCLTGNGDAPHQEWGGGSPGMGMWFTGNGDEPGIIRRYILT